MAEHFIVSTQRQTRPRRGRLGRVVALRCASTELNAHQVEARRVETADTPQEEERMVHFRLIRRLGGPVESIAILRQSERGAQLVAFGRVEIGKRFFEGYRIESRDTGIPHPWTFLSLIGDPIKHT
jgi:hypothetical protein